MVNNNENSEFNLNLNELFEQLAEFIETPLNSHQAYQFLLLLWNYFEVAIIEEDKESEGGESGAHRKYPTRPNIIQVEKGYQIFDYGSRLKTSSGKFYGSYTTGRLLTTVSSMINILIQRGAKQVKIDGLAAAKRFAWLQCEKNAIAVINFKPDLKEKTLQSQLNRLNLV
ncbi:MAG: hypothetical protein WAL30_05895 [Candidatus Aquirickettsiella sp.]